MVGWGTVGGGRGAESPTGQADLLVHKYEFQPNRISKNAYQIHQHFDRSKISRKLEHLLNFQHRISTTAVSTKLAILFNLVQAFLNTLIISTTDSQQFFPHGILPVTKQPQQTKFNIIKADVSRNLSTNMD